MQMVELSLCRKRQSFGLSEVNLWNIWSHLDVNKIVDKIHNQFYLLHLCWDIEECVRLQNMCCEWENRGRIRQ